MPNSELLAMRDDIIKARDAEASAKQEVEQLKALIDKAVQEADAASKAAAEKQRRLDEIRSQISLLPALKVRLNMEQQQAAQLAAAVKAAQAEIERRRAAINRAPFFLRAQLLAELQKLEIKFRDLQAQAAAAANRAAATKREVDSLNLLSAQVPAVQAEAEAARLAEAAAQNKLNDYRQRLADAEQRLEAGKDVIRKYHDKLGQLMRRLRPDLPIALLPVRIETRFVPVSGGTDLLVRVYPDDIGQDSHRRKLTEDEISWGKRFWLQHGGAASEEARRQAWFELAQRYAPERAAWIKESTRPGGNGPGQPAADAWGSAPQAALLPDRWTVLLYKGDRREMAVHGNPIIDPIATGPSPDPGVQVGNSGLYIDEGMLWMADFAQAVKIGMALRIRLTPSLESGIDRLVVMGVKVSLNDQESAEALGDLLDAHHYTWGLGFVPTGTPTNNTPDVPSGHGRRDTGFSDSFAAEFNASIIPGSNGSLAATALGLSPSAFLHAPHANGTDQTDAKIINQALWPATWGYFLFQMMDMWEPGNNLELWRSWFADHVRARGPLPALRVGNQPYGLLPVTSLDRFSPLLEPELIVVQVPAGTLQLLYRIGWNVSADGGDNHWSEPYQVPINLSSPPVSFPFPADNRLPTDIRRPTDVRLPTDGRLPIERFPTDGRLPSLASSAVVAVTTAGLKGNGTSDLIVYAAVRTSQGFQEFYQVGWQLNEEGAAQSWSKTMTVPAGTAGNTVSAAAASADLNGNGLPDLLIVRVTSTGTGLSASYCIGWDLDQDGRATGWSKQFPIRIADISGSVQLSAAIADLNGNGRPDIVIVMTPTSGGPSVYQIGWDLKSDGAVSRWTNPQRVPEWTSGAVQGVAVHVNIAGVAAPQLAIAYLIESGGSTGAYLHVGSNIDHDNGSMMEWVVRKLHSAPPKLAGGSIGIALADLGRSGRAHPGTVSGRVNLLRALRGIWRRSLPNVPYYGRSGSGNKNLVEMLGMDGVSGSYNVRPVMGPLYLNELWRFMKNPLDDVWWQNQRTVAGAGLKLAGLEGDPRLVELVLELEVAQLQAALVQEGAPADGQINPNYIREMIKIDPLTLHAAKPQRALLYLLLRHSLLWEYANAAVRAGFVQPVQMREPELIDIPERTTMTPLRWLRKPVPSDPNMTIADYLHKLSLKEPKRFEVALIGQFREYLSNLAGKPVAVLEELLKESLDLSSHRLDAWITACASERLSRLRSKRPRGIYTGGYGWVENLRPAQGKASKGYIHAPSPAHAATAAILRSGYLAHEGTGTGDMLAVDLSSERVRLALRLLDGIRQGQSLGALLGYRLERRLQDRSPGLMDKYIKVLRDLAPLTARKLIPGNDEAEAAAATSVVDGLALLRRWQKGTESGKWDRDTIPFDVGGTTLPSRGTADHAALEQELHHLADVVDAVSDLAVAESVYQTVQGNPIRAGASLEGISRGELLPPEPEVVRSARSGVGVTHRVIVMLGDVMSEDKNLKNWDAGEEKLGDMKVNELHMRAKAEPVLNAWAARLLGDPSRVLCRVLYKDEQTGATDEETFSLKQLHLSPLDVLYTAIPRTPEPVEGAADYKAQASEIEQRLLLLAEQSRPGKQAALIFDREPGWGPDKLSFPELFELVRSARTVITGARALELSDLLEPRDAARASSDQANQINLEELKKRADQAVQDLDDIVTSLAGLAAGNAAVEDLRNALLRLSYCTGGAVPIGGGATEDEQRRMLQKQAARLAGDMAEMVNRLHNEEAAFDRSLATAAEQVEHDRKRMQTVFGAEFRVLPKVQPKNAAALNKSFADQIALQKVIPWFQRIAKVRKGVANLETTLLYTEAVSGGDGISFDVAQLPYQPKDRWVGEELAQGQKLGGRLSLVSHRPAGFERTDWLAGLVIDELVEVIPSPVETTAVSFHYNAPGAVAPQAVLLAVAPDVNRPWDEFTLEAVLVETLELSKLRAVDCDALGDIRQYFPALLFAFNSADETFGMNLYDLAKPKT